VFINVIENKNEQCTVWNGVVMLIMTQKTGDDFYIISYNFVKVVSVKWGKVTITHYALKIFSLIKFKC
jgi:hypothetical protein